MNIIVNGETHNVPENCSAEALVNILHMQNDKIAMEVNLEIVPRSQYNTFTFKPDDQVEIVRAIGGGQSNQKYTNFEIIS